MKFKKFILAVLIMAMVPLNLSAQNYEDMWKKVYDAESKGLPQTALKELEPIYEKAIKEKDHFHAIKAICKKVITEGTIQGNSPEEKIIRFEKAVNSADKSIQPMLKVILAKWYFHYYNRNRYKFMRRSTTSADADLKDFKTWDLPKLFGHIGKMYDSVLENEEELSKIPISKFDGFLQSGNQPTDLRSNLFEFFVHEALGFYGDNNQSTIKPQVAFEIDADSNVFGSLDEFINWKPETLDSDSCNFKALKLYQRLLALNKATNNENALIYNDIERLNWAKKVALGPDKNDRYVEAMKRIIHEYPNNEYTATAMFHVANNYYEQGEFVKAVDYAEKAYEKFPKSAGGKKAYNLISSIKAPSITYRTEKILTSNTSKIKIAFKNLKHAYFRIIKRSESDILSNNSTTGDSYTRGEILQLLSQTPTHAFDVELDPESDYKVHDKLVDLPKLEKGFYWLIASARESFTEDDNAINVTALQISDLALISRNALKNGKNQAFVLDSVTGKPIEGAELKVYFFNYQGRKLTHITSATSNKSGSMEFSVNKNDRLMLFVKHKEDMMYKDVSWYSYNNGNEEATHQKLYFFTDRSIYRPGQTVYFKAIAIKYNQETNEYSVIKNKNLEITLTDPNSQKVNSLNLVTNEFGSVTGTFLTPTDRLPGTYTLKCSNIWATTYIKVEEYKRPKFKVNIDAPTDGYQLGQTVKLKGQALAYTGAAIDNAEVKFRVRRMVTFPYWCWWAPRVDNSQEITHGTIKTNENGEFEISFIAKPDRSIDTKLDPIFNYSVSADITDNTGETRSGARTVRIGYTAMELSISTSEKLNADESLKVGVVSSTHDGEPIKADGKIRIYKLVQPETPIRHSYGITEVTDDRIAIRNMKEGEVVFEERFATDDEGGFSKEIKLPEGLYRIKVDSEDRFGKEVTAQQDITVISHSSSKMSVKLPFFYETTSKDLKPGDTFKAFWATGYDQGPAYVEICHREKVLKSFWTDPAKNKEFFSYPVTEEMRGGFHVKVFQVKENSFYSVDRYVNVSWTTKNLKLKLVHFNSKMEPGSKESWKVEVSGEDAEMKSIEMLASMYDASLDAYASHYWPSIYVFYSDRNSINNTFSNDKNYLSTFRVTFKEDNLYPGYVRFPSFPDSIITDYYGYRYMDEGMVYESKAMGGRMLMKSVAAPGAARAVQDLDACDEVCESAAVEEPVMAGAVNSEEEAVDEEGDSSNEPDLSKVKARSNLNETAFFLPQLRVNEEGIVSIDFDMPESLTTWKFMGFAHGTKLQSGSISQEVITQKELMIQPNAPRFLREGDKIAFTVKVTNLSDKEQTGSVALELYDAITDESRNAEFKNNESKKSFTVPAKQSKGFSWILDVPYKPGFVRYKAVGATNTHSDGEEGLLPIFSSRILVTESTPLPIRGPETKTFKFEKLQKSGDSKTLEHKGLTVEMTSNPAWYAIQALPYLIEFPHECSEQTFNRIYANKLAQHIANSNPKIRRVFDIWAKDELYNKGTALMSNLEKNQHLKSVTLMETPWVLDAKDENEQKHHIGVLFEEARLKREIEEATKKLNNMQLSDGSFPWFPGGYGNTFITMYIMTGYGRLRNLGVEIDLVTALRCADFVDQMVREYYERIILHDKDYKEHVHIDSTIAFYLYGRSFFLKDRPIPGSCKVAVDFFIEQAKKYWLKVPYRMSQAHIALGLMRFGDKTTPVDIVKSIKERSVTDEEMGRFWRENEIGYSWNRADIETQAMMIEMFSEITKDEEAVEDCKVWLLKQKQTQCWKTTKSTADAIYALILRGCDLLASDKVVKVYLNNQEVKPEKVEAGTGYYQKIYSGAEVKPQMGNIQVKKEDKGVAWGAVHWQYIEDMSKVTPFENNLKLKKSLYIKTNTEKGPVITPVKDGKVRIGDLIVVRIELRTDRDLEFVHMKDQRGSGMEPVNVISRYKWQDGMGYYEATKDAASHFYIDYLAKGTYVFEYELRVQLAGQYQTGIAEIMCMYAPEFNSHSESFMLNVAPQE
ncbi:MAG: hypothetical protein II961_06775 [Candidatus Riflebacteria bacterium]|nr:hypothetical protein [Candidatus Riflebacteria bacterium]